jgi:hypothetical protein
MRGENANVHGSAGLANVSTIRQALLLWLRSSIIFVVRTTSDPMAQIDPLRVSTTGASR